MSTSLRPTTPAELEAEPEEPTYRLSVAQYRSMKTAGILTKEDRVELLEGFIIRKDAPPETEFYRLSVDQYHAMTRAGIIEEGGRIELLEGWLFAKMTKRPPHEIAKGLAQDLLIPLAPHGWFVAIESPTTTFDSEPEPDLMVVRGSRRDYQTQAPSPREVSLIIEVADSSLLRDRSIKKRLYARAGYSTYWLINLVENRIEVYTEPTGPAEEPDYRRRQDFGPDEMIPLVIEGREVGRLAVRDLLP
jgi:Uma2 family endonuclease